MMTARRQEDGLARLEPIEPVAPVSGLAVASYDFGLSPCIRTSEKEGFAVACRIVSIDSFENDRPASRTYADITLIEIDDA
jgi:hypothetical protein